MQGKFQKGGIQMKKIGIFVMALMLSLLVFGCEEVEKREGMETGKASKSPLVEKVDLSAVSAPKEAAVYAAAFFDKKPEEVARIFLGDAYEEGETAAEGRVFVSDAGSKKEKMVLAYDSGKAFFGDNPHYGNIGVKFSSCCEFCYNNVYTNNDEYRNMVSKYDSEERISDDGRDGAFGDKQERIAGYLESLGVNGYELHSAGTFQAGQREGCLMYFKQMVDGIPVSSILCGDKSDVMLYNYRYRIISEIVAWLDTDVQVCFLEDELIGFDCRSLVNVGRPLKKYSLVSVDDAYEKVKECYPAADTGGSYELERAELQYGVVMPDFTVEKIYLYPVWLFGVHNVFDDQNRRGAMAENEWTYYIVDAVTGELFSDIPEERLRE